MKFSPRKMSLIAAAAGVAATLWIASGAMAAEINPLGKQTASVAFKRHPIWPRYRVAAWYASRLRYADAAPAGWQGYLAPRPVLLMVGIAY